jgi:hypothetical protein
MILADTASRDLLQNGPPIVWWTMWRIRSPNRGTGLSPTAQRFRSSQRVRQAGLDRLELLSRYMARRARPHR